MSRHASRRNTRPPEIEVEDVNTRRLPPQLRQLVRVLGRVKAFELVEQLGGTAVVGPERVRPHHAQHYLFERLGAQRFAALVEAYGGTTLQLPKYDSVARQARHEHVRTLLDQGHCVADVALRTGYTMRHVHNIKAEDRANTMQGDLFADWFEAQPAPADAAVPTAHNPFPRKA